MGEPIVAGESILATDFTGTRYLAIGPSNFQSINNSENFSVGTGQELTNTETPADSMVLSTNVNLPHGATVTSLKIFWFRDFAGASGNALLRRLDFTGSGGTPDNLAQADSDSSAGAHTVEDTTISNAVIDNTAFYYHLVIALNTGVAITDVSFRGAIITFTITNPKP
jgi:hypothetical protein